VTLAGYALAGWCGVASAQTFYKWTDERGVVHFSDVPPATTQEVEERNLPSRPAAAPSAPEPGEIPATGEGKTGVPGAASFEGPARVIVVSRRLPRTGPSAMHISGEVKNVGGEDAENVSVTISALDSGQGNPCLHEEVTVSPSTLRAGETGNFDIELDNPCLFGEPKIDIATTSE
jgi:hypothetical protein